MTFEFYGYRVRSTRWMDDLGLAVEWAGRENDPCFWLRQSKGRESFLVSRGNPEEPLAFFQIEHVGHGDQVRLHWQPSPAASPKKLLRGITKLVPVIEKALTLRGVRVIFFTSKSLAMVNFMEKLGYRLYPGMDGGADGVVMAKEIESRVKTQGPSTALGMTELEVG
jgi:hypothetical protein